MENDKDRLRLIKALAQHNTFTCEQAATLMAVAHFGGAGIEAALMLWSKITDKENEQTLVDSFEYADEKQVWSRRLLPTPLPSHTHPH
jgi:hypothetical protein